MAAVNVAAKLVEKVTLVRYVLGPEVPEVVMAIADRNFRLQRLFGGQSQPVSASVRHGQSSNLDFNVTESEV
jgi:hypothetical protein